MLRWPRRYGQLGERDAGPHMHCATAGRSSRITPRWHGRSFGKWFDADITEHLVDGLRKAGLRRREPRRARTSDPASRLSARAAPVAPSIAVLPFTDMSADKEQSTSATAWRKKSSRCYTCAGTPGDRTDVGVRVSWQGAGHPGHRGDAWRPHDSPGQRPTRRQPYSGRGAADQRRRRRSSLVGTLRSRDDRGVCAAGRNRRRRSRTR